MIINWKTLATRCIPLVHAKRARRPAGRDQKGLQRVSRKHVEEHNKQQRKTRRPGRVQSELKKFKTHSSEQRKYCKNIRKEKIGAND